MNALTPARRFWLLTAAFCLFWQMAATAPCHALSWQWSSLPDRERVVITLDKAEPWSLNRVGKEALALNLPSPPETIAISENVPGPDKILKTVNLSPNGIYLFTNTNAFGYVVSREANNRLRVDIFPDPLGARWQGTGEEPKPVDPAGNGQTASANQQGQGGQAGAAGASPAAQSGPRTQMQALIQAQNQIQGQTPDQTPGQTPGQVASQAAGQRAEPQTGQQLGQIASGQVNSSQAIPSQAAPSQAASGQASGAVAPPPPPSSVLGAASSATPPAPVPGPSSGPVQGGYVAPPSAVPDVPASGQTVRENTLVDSLRDIPRQPAQQAGGNAASAAADKNAPFKFENNKNEPGQLFEPVSPPPPVAATNASDQAGEQAAGQAQQAAPQSPLQTNAQPPVQQHSTGGTFRSKLGDSSLMQSVPMQTQGQVSDSGPAQSPDKVATQNVVQRPVQDNSSNLPALGDVAGSTLAQPVRQQVQGMTPAELEKAMQEQTSRQAQQSQPPKQSAEEVKLDEEGNPIAPPPPFEDVMAGAQENLSAGAYEQALNKLNELKARTDLTERQREDTLYAISDAKYGLGSNDFLANGQAIIAASEEALNFNPKSERLPAMLLRLGLVNLKTGNVQDAEAYFNLLKRQYPNNENIPLIYYYWGDYFFNQEKYQQAADQFQYLVQHYPESTFVREASVGLARSLYKLGYFEQSFEIVDYIEKRWPRFYMEYPPILSMVADAAYQVGRLDDAKARYWLYYNLMPSGPEAGTVLTRLGDIYLSEKKPKAAKEVYEEAVRRFPNDDAGLVAMMRLAEEGINDAPSINDMFSVFDRPYSELPYQTYERILKEHPNSAVAPLANLKLAMWYLWNKRYSDALRAVTDFEKRFPNHPLLPKAKEVAMNAFSLLAAEGVRDNEYGRVMQVWDEFPILQRQSDDLSGESRLALAVSEWNQKRSANALKTLEPFFRGAKDFENGEPALSLALTVLIDAGQWPQVADLYNKVEMWELTPETQRQLDYAMALASENMNKPEQAATLWEALRQRADLPLDQKAYMFYFLARGAERKKDMETAYYLGREALQNLMEIGESSPEKVDPVKIKDTLAMLIGITEGAGRTQEALDWQQQYSKYVQPGDADYPAMRYRLAQLYKKSGDLGRWGVILQELVEKEPNSLYGRMAASELKLSNLSNEVNSFLPPGQ